MTKKKLIVIFVVMVVLAMVGGIALAIWCGFEPVNGFDRKPLVMLLSFIFSITGIIGGMGIAYLVIEVEK